MAEVIATVAGSCLTSAFSLWCHRMFLEYVTASVSPFLTTQVLPQALRLERWGATGLANAMKHIASLEELRVSAEPREGGFVLSGRLPWVSNLVGDRFVVAVAARCRDSILLLAVPGDSPGVSPGPRLPLFGLEGSASASLLLEDVPLSEQWVIARDGGAFLQRVRPAFLILQSALAWGLAEAALASVFRNLSGPRAVLADRAWELDDALARLVAELRALARHGGEDKTYRALKVRKELAELAVQAVWLELEAAGGAGVLVGERHGPEAAGSGVFPRAEPEPRPAQDGAGPVRGGRRVVIEVAGAGKDYSSTGGRSRPSTASTSRCAGARFSPWWDPAAAANLRCSRPSRALSL